MDEHDEDYAYASGRMVEVDKDRTVTAVALRPDQATYDCSRCGQRPVTAELLVPGTEECQGYCVRCIGLALLAEQQRGDSLGWPGLGLGGL